MTIKVKVSVSTGFVGSKRSDVLDFPDDATEEDIEQGCQDWLWDAIDFYWEREE